MSVGHLRVLDIHECWTLMSIGRGVGAKLEVVRQNFRAVSKFHDQNWRIHIQLPKATPLPMAAHARGVWGHAPPGNF